MSDNNVSVLLRISILLSALTLITGCQSSSPTIDTSPDAELTYDGLATVKGGTADLAWVRPGADISQYSKIRLQGVGIEYRPGGDSGRTYMARTRGGHFEVTPEQRARFEQGMSEAFREELALSEHFTLVEEDGPDVLLIMGGLLDVVSYVPPETAGRTEVFLSRVGEATLVIEIRDSITHATLARAIDRRAAESTTEFTHSNRVRNRAEFRRVAKHWARLLRTRLDELAAK